MVVSDGFESMVNSCWCGHSAHRALLRGARGFSTAECPSLDTVTGHERLRMSSVHLPSLTCNFYLHPRFYSGSNCSSTDKLKTQQSLLVVFWYCTFDVQLICCGYCQRISHTIQAQIHLPAVHSNPEPHLESSSFLLKHISEDVILFSATQDCSKLRFARRVRLFYPPNRRK